MEYIASAYKNCMDFFFPDFWEKVDQIEDPRVAGRCIYTLRQLLGTELARCFSAIESHRLMDSLFSRPGTAEGISQLCGEAGETVPRGDTINYSLAKMQPQYLHSMIDDMAFVLLAGKRLERCREPLAHYHSSCTRRLRTALPGDSAAAQHHQEAPRRQPQLSQLCAFARVCVAGGHNHTGGMRVCGKFRGLQPGVRQAGLRV
jgi:hypothetical protein